MRDPEPGGLNYYRVKMIEADGKFQYSAIVKSVNHFKDNWNFIYVPGNDHIEVNGIVRGDEIRIYDLNGRMIRSNKSTGNKTIINTTGIANGTYFISVLTDLQLTTRQLIILR